MVCMKRYIPFLLSLIFLPVFAFANSTAGIPSGGLWFSKDPFFAGDAITISTVVFNATQNDITGNLELMDKESVLEKKEITLLAGQNKVVEFPVSISEGKHVFSIRVAGGDFNIKGGTALQLKSKSGNGSYLIETTKVVRDALKDTDSDGIADIYDTDIDGDGLTNELEKKLGTNAYLADTDGDSILDGVDKNPLKIDKLPSATVSISSSDTKKVTDSVEKIIPAGVVSPVANVATPIISTIESVRVGEANRNNLRISNSIDDIIDNVGTSKVLGAHTEATSTKSGVIKSPTGKPSGYEVLKTSTSNGNFSKTPFGYTKLFLLVIYQFILSNIWVFYILLLIIVLRILIGIKRRIFRKDD